jgi:multiple sugar transport system substrate-binding protein
MSRKPLYVFALVAVLALLVGSIVPAAAQDKVTVTWFVGLGGGTGADQLDAQQKVADEFNASQDKINLVVNIVHNPESYQVLATQLGTKDAPDIVGPVGVSGANSFPGAWMDLQPLVDKNNYDLSVFPENLIKLYQTPDGLVGIPFAVFPSLMVYNKDLFDEAGLAYPPHEFGAKYVAADGTESDWDFNTVADLAKTLTVDGNGSDATSADFDPENIVQFGFAFDNKSIRNQLTSWNGDQFWDPATNKVTIHDNWRAGAQWIWDGIWKYHFSPNATQIASDLLKGGAFASGHVAMAQMNLWNVCCVGDAQFFDVAALPSYNGTPYSAVDADTFRVLKSTQHPDETFTVLSYLLDQAVPELTAIYSAYPARPEYQQVYLDGLDARFQQKADWKTVVVESLNYAGSPHHESWFPGFSQGQSLWTAFGSDLTADTGADMDVNARLDQLQTDLQATIDAALNGTLPTDTPSS